MVEVLSADEVRRECIRDMGPNLGREYHALWNEAVWLHAKWDEYKRLYGRSPERVAFLNKVAPHFFWVIQEILHDEILLHIARLVDTRGGTLRLQRLPQLGPAKLASELKCLIDAAVSACKPAMAVRNERVAHKNCECALGAATFKPNPSRAEIDSALHAIRAVLNCLSLHFWEREAGCEHFYPSGGADDLVRYLSKGVWAEKRRMERFIQGKPLPEDLEPEGDI